VRQSFEVFLITKRRKWAHRTLGWARDIKKKPPPGKKDLKDRFFSENSASAMKSTAPPQDVKCQCASRQEGSPGRLTTTGETPEGARTTPISLEKRHLVTRKGKTEAKNCKTALQLPTEPTKIRKFTTGEKSQGEYQKEVLEREINHAKNLRTGGKKRKKKKHQPRGSREIQGKTSFA